MNRKGETFFDAITLLPEGMVEEAQDYAFRKSRTSWRKFASLAACMMLVVSLGLLAALPRGCGGAAPDWNKSEPPIPSGDVSPGAMPQEPEDTLDGAEPAAQFTAMVIEVRDSGTQAILLVEPMDGEDEKKVADRIEVATGKELPEVSAGDFVLITYDGTIQETYPARITGVVSIERQEK